MSIVGYGIGRDIDVVGAIVAYGLGINVLLQPITAGIRPSRSPFLIPEEVRKRIIKLEGRGTTIVDG